MPQVTKTLNGTINGISVSIDGANINTSVMWTDTAPTQPISPVPGAPSRPSRPLGVSAISIRGGKVMLGQIAIADAPASIAKDAASLAAAVKSLVEGLISSGKIAL